MNKFDVMEVNAKQRERIEELEVENQRLRGMLGEFIAQANNIEAYGAMKHELDWVKLRVVRNAAQTLLAEGGE